MKPKSFSDRWPELGRFRGHFEGEHGAFSPLERALNLELYIDLSEPEMVLLTVLASKASDAG
ncbi:hypothetical protein [Ruegeria sp. HKCCA6837]|uniref:hypothetical protein n=1 Tax=Ruegeria sp. HKCCA6837 TaxID=2682989 RepID=UPI0014888DD4|nr:hypothetical protein [Ruegeria sp. HKCCA6837]